MSPRGLHRFAIAAAVAAYLLILVGGLVHATGSSLACPDWPTCYGSFTPKMEGGVLVEHSHRLAAGTVTVMTLALAILFQRARVGAAFRLRRIAWMAVGLVVVQATLGGVTVLLRLPTPVSTLHTATSLLFFLTLVYLALRARPDGLPGPQPLPGRAIVWLTLATVALYFQMVLGGLVRHSGAALACPDVPLCRGRLWPDWDPVPLVHMLHRMNAILAAALLAVAAAAVLRARTSLFGRALAGLALGLVAVQITLGLYAVWDFLPLAVVEAHLAVATALLAVLFVLLLRGLPAPSPDAEPGRTPLAFVQDAVRLGKPRLSGLVIATFAGGLWLAPVPLARWRALMTLLGTVLVVGAANAFNMLLERDVDGLMERTRERPLPRGRLEPHSALVVGAVLACAALPLLVLGGNPITATLAAVAFASYVAVYTPLKRTSPAALFVGAVPGAIPPVMGWTAATGRLDAPAAVLFGILFFWQIPHFLAIATFRSADYAAAGFKVMPLVTERVTVRRVIVLFSGLLVAVTFLFVPLGVAGRIYVGAAAILGAAFLAVGAAGLRASAERRWARGLFYSSLAYLTLLFAALAVDRALR